MAATTLFPLQYRRQDAVPIDEDQVFATTAARMTYLTSPRRYAGQLVYDQETDSCFYMNAARTAWIPIGGGSSGPQVLGPFTSSVTMDPSHFGNILWFTNGVGSPAEYVVTEEFGEECPPGTTVVLARSGTGTLTIAVGASDPLINTPETLSVRKRYGKVTLTKMQSPDYWEVEGNLTPFEEEEAGPPTIFFGYTPVPALDEDFTGENTIPAGPALAARNNFLASGLSNVANLDFEAQTAENPATAYSTTPRVITYPAPQASKTITITTEAGGHKVRAYTSYIGRYNTTPLNLVGFDGGHWLDFRQDITITFNTPIRAFGFYGMDFSDFLGVVGIRLTFTDTSEQTIGIPITAPAENGNLIFWGFRTPAPNLEVTKIKLYCTYDTPPAPGSEDFFGIDDLIVANVP